MVLNSRSNNKGLVRKVDLRIGRGYKIGNQKRRRAFSRAIENPGESERRPEEATYENQKALQFEGPYNQP